jgi:hypothetical protein
MKTCTICETEKPLTEFLKRKDQKDGLHFWCKSCLKIKKAESYQKNRGKALASMAAYRAAHPEKVAAAKKAAYAKKPEQYAAKRKAQYAANPELFKSKAKAWKAENPEQRAKTEAEYRKRRYRQDPIYALETLCRARISMAFSSKRIRKGSPTAAMVGCTYQKLRDHLERQFAPGMTWENRGTAWHIDHRTPLASATNAQELEALCHFSNLQPLWAEDNYAKGAKMPHDWEGARWPTSLLTSSEALTS